MYVGGEQGDPPDPVEILSQYPPGLVSHGLKLLKWLESIDWQWDINTLLAQPDDELEIVMTLRSLGEAMREQNRKKQKPPVGSYAPE
jgi:hypothetical protein